MIQDRIRAATAADAEGVAATIDAVTAGWLAWPRAAADELISEWTSLPEARRWDRIVSVDPAGAISGYAAIRPTRGSVWIELRSGSEEALAALLERCESRAHAWVPPGIRYRVRTQVHDRQVALGNLLEASGYRAVRHIARMTTSASHDPAPRWPNPFVVRRYVPGQDDRQVYDAYMRAFADTWEFTPEPFESWIGLVRRPQFRPDLSLVALADGEVAGFLLGEVTAEDDALGWMHAAAVTAPWRGRGLAGELLRYGLTQFTQNGILNVGTSADEEGGGFLLARRVGFQTVERFATFESVVVPRAVARIRAAATRRLRARFGR